MVTIQDVPVNDLVDSVAQKLREIDGFDAPLWAKFVKTGVHKERPPVNPEWWHIRAAAVLRSINNLGPIGVSKLRKKYGGKKDRGYQPSIFKKGSGSIIRKILQQLEEAGLVSKTKDTKHKGRIITPKGVSLLDKTATEIKKKMPKKIITPVAKKPVKKDKPAEKAPDKPAEKAPAKPAEKAPAKPAEKAPAKPAEKAPAKPAEKAPAKPAEKAPAKPAEKAPVKPAEKAPAKPAEKAPVKPAEAESEK